MKLFDFLKPEPTWEATTPKLSDFKPNLIQLFGGNQMWYAPSHRPKIIKWNGRLLHEGNVELYIYELDRWSEKVTMQVLYDGVAELYKDAILSFAFNEASISMGNAQACAKDIYETYTNTIRPKYRYY